jgi:hypothetical protein
MNLFNSSQKDVLARQSTDIQPSQDTLSPASFRRQESQVYPHQLEFTVKSHEIINNEEITSAVEKLRTAANVSIADKKARIA